MKILTAFMIASVVTITAAAQDVAENQIPSAVLTTFKEKYPNAAGVTWKMDDQLYRAEYEVGSRGHDVWLSKDGRITKHKEDFPKKQLPEAIQQQLATEFKGYELDDADKIDSDGKVFYEVDLKGVDKRKVLFTADGKVQENNVD